MAIALKTFMTVEQWMISSRVAHEMHPQQLTSEWYDLFLVYRKGGGLFPMEQAQQPTLVFSISQPGKQREYSLVPESITSEEQRYWSSMVFFSLIKNKYRITRFYWPWSLLLGPPKRDKNKREKGGGHYHCACWPVEDSNTSGVYLFLFYNFVCRILFFIGKDCECS